MWIKMIWISIWCRDKLSCYHQNRFHHGFNISMLCTEWLHRLFMKVGIYWLQYLRILLDSILLCVSLHVCMNFDQFTCCRIFFIQIINTHRCGIWHFVNCLEKKTLIYKMLIVFFLFRILCSHKHIGSLILTIDQVSCSIKFLF